MPAGQGWIRIGAGAASAMACIAMAVTASYAGTTGEIVGRITDSTTRASVAGATITAMSTTGDYRAKTDRDGFFSIVGAFPNTYLLAVTAPGFATLETLAGAVNPDQTTVVDVQVDEESSTLTNSPVPNVLSILRTNVADDRSVFTAAAADATNGSGGSYGLYQTPSVLGTLPGVTIDEGVNAHVRGGRLDQVGYEFDGVGIVDPITGLAATNLIQDGIVRLQIDESGDVTGGAGGTATVDEVPNAGTYPPHGSITTLVESPTFYNGVNFDYGTATPDRRFSWYASGVDWNSGYDWGTRGAFVPGAQSAETALGDGPVGAASPARDQLIDVHYRPGDSEDVQFLAASGFVRFDDMLAVRTWPSMDPIYGASTSAAPVGGACDVNGFALFPGQPNCTAGVGSAVDHVDQTYSLQELQFTRAIDSDASLAVRFARVDSRLIASLPFGDAPFGDTWEDRHSVQRELGVEYDVQPDRLDFVRVGTGVDASDNSLLEEFISNGYGIVAGAPTRRAYAWIADEFRPKGRLTLDAAGRTETQSYGRLAAPASRVSAMEGSLAAAFAIGDRTAVRAFYGDLAAMPTVAAEERIITRSPSFSDIAGPNRIAALESAGGARATHAIDASFERGLGNGRALKVTSFWRTSPALYAEIGTALAAAQPASPAFARGIDAEFQFLHAGDGVSGYVDYTHTQALAASTGDLLSPVGLGAEAAHALFPVAYIAPDVANAVLTWHRGRWSVNPEIAYTPGFPFGAGRLTYNDLHCAGATGSNVGNPAAPCGAIVRNPAAYSDTIGGDCGPGACTRLLDPAESTFADGRVCCAALTANLNVFFELAARTQIGVQWQNVTHDTAPLAMTRNPYFPVSAFGAPGSNGFLDYGAQPYIPAALDNSEGFILTITQKL